MNMNNMIRRAVLLNDGFPDSVITRFEAENPEAVIKINPLKLNSPRLYDREAFERWWERCCKAQIQAKRMRTMVF